MVWNGLCGCCIHYSLYNSMTILMIKSTSSPFLSNLQRSSQWLNEEDLFVSGITVCPHNAKVRIFIIGHTLHMPMHGLYMHTCHVQVLYNIGKVRSDAGDTETGIAAYREAIRQYYYNNNM